MQFSSDLDADGPTSCSESVFEFAEMWLWDLPSSVQGKIKENVDARKEDDVEGSCIRNDDVGEDSEGFQPCPRTKTCNKASPPPVSEGLVQYCSTAGKNLGRIFSKLLFKALTMEHIFWNVFRAQSNAGDQQYYRSAVRIVSWSSSAILDSDF